MTRVQACPGNNNARNSMRRHSRNQQGFTLTEVLVASAIFVIVIVAALLMYDRGNRTFKQGVEAGNMQQNTRVAFEKMLSDLRMAGYDYDRDGIPSAGTQQQQPDEQIEFIGRSAITFRGNFNYDTATAACTSDPTSPVQCDNGRERAYEPTTGEYPVVTTANNEIVTYALVSKTAAANTDSVNFFADIARPRNSFTSPESQVTIDGVDFSNNNPPYTLYRFTLKDDGTIDRTPIAENIRSLVFDYYEDANGTTPLRNLANPPVTIASASLATSVGGLGQYTPADPTAILPERNIRLKINAVKVTLIGMNEAQDGGYTDATDTVAPKFRKFSLTSLVVPRNTGRRGVLEQEYRAPGAPQIERICYGFCGVAIVTWTAPAANSSNGAPEQYIVYADTVPGGNARATYVGNVLTAAIPIQDPSQRYFFSVEAINSYGSAISASMPTSAPGIDVRNRNTPSAPLNVTATGYGAVPAQANKVVVTWNMPQPGSVSGLACTSGSAPTMNAPFEEVAGFRVFRRVSGQPWPLLPIVNESTTGPLKPVYNVFNNTVTFNDYSAANCVNYEYKVQTIERCLLASTNSSGSVVGISADSNVANGSASSTSTPAAPSSLVIVTGVSQSSCPDPSDAVAAAGNCTIKLDWTQVNSDTTGGSLAVNEYIVRKTRKLTGNASYSRTFPDIIVTKEPLGATAPATGATFGATNVTLTDTVRFNDETTPVPNGQYYFEYYVYARSCTIEGAASPMAKFPCAFSGGTVSGTISGALEGAGTSASPWLVDSPVSLVVNTTSGVSSIAATWVPSSGAPVLLPVVTGSPTVSSGTFAIPSMSSGDTGSLYVNVTDTNGCPFTRQFFLSEASSNCCLNPVSIDATIATNDPSTRTVTYRLKNSCAQTLDIRSITVTWNNGYTSSPSPRMDIFYPATLGEVTPSVQAANNVSSATTSQSRPSGALASLPTDNPNVTTDDYKIRFTFTQNFSANPIQKLCIVYRGPSDLADRICRIAPDPAPTPDTCP